MLADADRLGGVTTPPKAFLLDYGGTLVEEIATDLRAGNALLLARAVPRPGAPTLDEVMRRADLVTAEIADRRDLYGIETPWPALTRLIHDYFGTRFTQPLDALELDFWRASVTTRPMPGAREALEAFHRAGLPMAVLSNSSFGARVIGDELARHGLADRLAFVMVSAEYVVRKPNPRLFETAAARLGVAPADVWVVGDRLDTDVAGARAAGMTAVWFGAPPAAPTDVADVLAADWAEVVRRVEG